MSVFHWFYVFLVSCDRDDGDSGLVNEDAVGNLINQDNANALVLQAFEVYSGRAYDDRLNNFPYELSDDNSVDILNEVFAFYSGHGYVDTLHSLPGYSDDQYVIGPDLLPTDMGGYEFGEPINVGCSGGGTAAFTPVQEEFFRYTA